MTTAEDSAHFWQRASRRLARRVNFGWWLSQWMGWWMVAALLGSVAVLLVRRYATLDLHLVWAASGFLLLIGGIAAWIVGRRRFETAEMARVRLEDAHHLKSRLSSAAAGVGPWPAPVARLLLPVRVRWMQPVGLLLSTGLIVWLASVVPIASSESEKKRIIATPPAAQDVRQWIDKLREKNAASKPSLEAVEKKISDLLRRPAENWYQHGSLEAAGNLKEETAESLREMSQNLADAERAANALSKLGSTLPQAAKDALAKNLATSAEGLRSGDLQPNEELLKQLHESAGDHPEMSQDELNKLAQSLKDAMEALKEALENSPDIHLSETRGDGDPDDGPARGGQPGDGDPNPGPNAPLTLKKNATDLAAKNLEKLKSSKDLSRMAPSDVLGITDGKHRVDPKAYQGPKRGGTADSPGEGGAAVWQNALVPEERETLKRYFK